MNIKAIFIVLVISCIFGLNTTALASVSISGQPIQAETIQKLRDALDLIKTDKAQAIKLLKSTFSELRNVREVLGNKKQVLVTDVIKRTIHLIKIRKITKAEITLNSLITALLLDNDNDGKDLDI